MTRRVGNPLVLAIALALVPIAALAVMLGPARHGASPPRTGVAAAILTPTASPTITPTPPPTPLPMLSVADRLDLGPPRAYGSVEVRSDALLSGFTATSYTLSTTPGAFPSSLPVWKLRGFASNNTGPLAVRLGIPTTGTPGGAGAIDATHGSAHTGIAHLSLGATPTTDESVAAAATRLLRDLGVPPLNSDIHVSGSSGTPREWQVSFERHHLAGVQVGSEPAYEASLTVVGDGIINEFSVTEQAADGGSVYALRDWHQAWSELRSGHWVTVAGLGPHGNPGPDDEPGGSNYHFKADKVFLYYEDAGTTPDYLVPFYGFTDSRWGITVGAPALRSADVHATPATPWP